MSDIHLGEIASDRPPRLSVGLAVYNGEPYLRQAIESILSQTYGDFELIICDNASEDATAAICAEFAARDDRVRYHRNPYNVGGVRNENRTMFLARGELFKLAAHDDVIAEDYLAECVGALDADHPAELAVPAVVVIDSDGNVLPGEPIVAGIEATAPRRIRALTDRQYMCEATYGVARLSALRAVPPQDNSLHSDRILLCELALREPFRFARGAVLYRRLHLGNVLQDARAHMSWFQPELRRSGRVRLPHWKLLVGYARMVARADVGRTDRARCALEVGRWALTARRSLAMDLFDAGRMLLIGRNRRRRRYGGLAANPVAAGPGDGAVTTAVVVLGPAADATAVAPSLAAWLDAADRSGVYPTVLDAGGLAGVDAGVADRLRRDGVPVIATVAEQARRSTSIARAAELALLLRLADAGTVQVFSDDMRLFRRVDVARRLVPDLGEVTRSGYASALPTGGGPR